MMPASPTIRKHLHADALIRRVRTGFQTIPDHRPGQPGIALADALMAGFARFALKDPSLLALDDRRSRGEENLHSVSLIDQVPCDTQLRQILDPLNPDHLRPVFRDVFRQVQRGKALEPLV